MGYKRLQKATLFEVSQLSIVKKCTQVKIGTCNQTSAMSPIIRTNVCKMLILIANIEVNESESFRLFKRQYCIS